MSSEFSNSLSLIANSLRYGLRNELEIQNLKIYILINTTTTHYTYCIYHPLTHVFYPVLRVCVRVRAREAMSFTWETSAMLPVANNTFLKGVRK